MSINLLQKKINSCSFKGQKLDNLIQGMAFPNIKATLKLNYSLLKIIFTQVYATKYGY